MQQIERYGVIALVFLLVTIVAISFWGDSKSPGFWSRLTGKNQPKKEEVAKLEPPALPPQIADPKLILSPAPVPSTPQPVDSLGGDVLTNPIDNPGTGLGTVLNSDGLVDSTPRGTTDIPPPIRDFAAPVPTTYPPMTTPRVQPQAPAAGNEYVVKSGDSFARIARIQLGAESRWTEIAALNPSVSAKSLNVGQKLRLPSGAAPMIAQGNTPTKSVSSNSPKPSAPKAAPKTSEKAVASSRACVVQKGDTLRSIARRELGDERRWREIAQVNPSVDPNKLAIGARLKLPGKGAELLVATGGSTSTTKKPQVR